MRRLIIRELLFTSNLRKFSNTHLVSTRTNFLVVVLVGARWVHTFSGSRPDRSLNDFRKFYNSTPVIKL